MVPSLLPVSSSITIPTEALTPAAFAPFGTAIVSPLLPSTDKPPTWGSAPTPPPLYPGHQPEAVVANQGSALKYADISPLVNNYPPEDAKAGKPRARAQISLFACFPRLELGSGAGNRKFQVKILERHPYTTQTFCPLGLSAPAAAEKTDTYFLVIVAPSLSSPATSSDGGIRVQRPPDLRRLRAFVANGGQAVTYGPGTWHAPMVVVGEHRVDFVVSQFVNGIGEDDCQEVRVAEGVEVSLDSGDRERNLKGKL